MVTKDENGQLYMTVVGKTIGGTYTKTGDKIVTSPQQCLHDGCSKKAVTTGDSFYCENHSNKCLVCGCYIDEDAMFCLNCIVEALKTTKSLSVNKKYLSKCTKGCIINIGDEK